MIKPDDGGPAFPVPNDANMNGQEGMTLRDWFAGQALAGWVSDPTASSGNGGARSAATSCYEYADAMIEARKGKEGA